MWHVNEKELELELPKFHPQTVNRSYEILCTKPAFLADMGRCWVLLDHATWLVPRMS